VAGTTGAKVKNTINDLRALTGYSGSLIANGNFEPRPPHPRAKLGYRPSPEVAAPSERMIANPFGD
jgi:hypothetical protein